jgi:hypothetical protein
MKKVLATIVAFALMALSAHVAIENSAHADALGFKGTKFHKEVWVCGTTAGTGDSSGRNGSNCLPFGNVTAFAIPAGTIVEKVYVIVDVAVANGSAFLVGDDDTSNGYIPSAAVTLGTPGLYGFNCGAQGTYLRDQGDGSSPAGAKCQAKYYSVGTKSVKLGFTGVATAGALRVIVEGTYLYQ